MTKSYAGRVILDDLSFDILRGECFVILGRSGTGKSVTLRQLNGLEKPDKGSVVFDGVALTKLEERELYPVTSATIGKLLNSIQKELGVTAVVVTHDIPLARRVGDRLALLVEGRFCFLGDWQEADSSQDPLVADFLAGREEDEENAA